MLCLPTDEVDPWGRAVVDPERVFALFYLGAKPSEIICDVTDEIERYNKLCEQWDKPNEKIHSAIPLEVDPEQDRLNRIADWKIPDEYADLDVQEYLLALCTRQDEIDRVNMEMALFEERGLLPLLRLMIVLVMHFRTKKIVWGVGRGSSVSSYCLYLIGVHKIDSIKYDLDVREFLR